MFELHICSLFGQMSTTNICGDPVGFHLKLAQECQQIQPATLLYSDLLMCESAGGYIRKDRRGTKQEGLQTPQVPNQGSSAFVSLDTKLLSSGHCLNKRTHEALILSRSATVSGQISI